MSDAKPSNAHSTKMFSLGCDGSKSGNELRPGSRHSFYCSWQMFGTISARNRLYKKMRCPIECTTAGLPPRAGVWRMVCDKDGVWKMVSDKDVCVCVKDGVWQRWCVKMVCDKDGVWQRWCVKDGVWQRWCVKDGEWQRCVCVWKMVCDKDGVWQRWCVKDGVWQRWCVTKMVCDKDGVWKMVCDKDGVWKMVSDKDVCVCVKDGVWQRWCVTFMVCDKDGVWQRREEAGGGGRYRSKNKNPHNDVGKKDYQPEQFLIDSFASHLIIRCPWKDLKPPVIPNART